MFPVLEWKLTEGAALEKLELFLPAAIGSECRLIIFCHSVCVCVRVCHCISFHLVIVGNMFGLPGFRVVLDVNVEKNMSRESQHFSVNHKVWI